MHTALLLSRRSLRRALLVSGPVIPAVALQHVGGAWVVDTANTTTPDGYFAVSGGKLVIDTAASSGLPISASGKLLVGS